MAQLIQPVCPCEGPGAILDDIRKNRVAQRIQARAMIQTPHLREQRGVWEEN